MYHFERGSFSMTESSTPTQKNWVAPMPRSKLSVTACKRIVKAMGPAFHDHSPPPRSPGLGRPAESNHHLKGHPRWPKRPPLPLPSARTGSPAYLVTWLCIKHRATRRHLTLASKHTRSSRHQFGCSAKLVSCGQVSKLLVI